MDFDTYPKTRSYEKAAKDLAGRDVVISEKIHGTSFRVQWEFGRDLPRYGSRKRELVTVQDASTFFNGAPVRWFEDRPHVHEAARGWLERAPFTGYRLTLYGEIFGCGIQRGVKYLEDGIGFRAYAVAVDGRFRGDPEWICRELDVPMVPELYRGPLPGKATLDDMRQTTSHLAYENGIRHQEAEGIVIRAQRLTPNSRGELPIAKLKSPTFEERCCVKSGRATKITDPGPRIIAERFAERFVTRGRLANVHGALVAEGTLPVGEPSVQDMRVLIPAMQADVREECREEWDAAVREGTTDKLISGATISQLRACLMGA